MLQIIIANEDGRFPPELRANVCSLLGSLGKKLNPAAPGREEDVQAARLKGPITAAMRSMADQVTNGDDEKTTILRTAAQKALEAWQ